MLNIFPEKRPQIPERKTKHRPQTPSPEVSTGTANPKDQENVPRRPGAPGGKRGASLTVAFPDQLGSLKSRKQPLT